ncbi:hypothetical protein T08_10670 [Trichinella sp. T8]|nr:hypothetical protein T08_10670 [Trichinella sp. T8]
MAVETSIFPYSTVVDSLDCALAPKRIYRAKLAVKRLLFAQRADAVKVVQQKMHANFHSISMRMLSGWPTACVESAMTFLLR